MKNPLKDIKSRQRKISDKGLEGIVKKKNTGKEEIVIELNGEISFRREKLNNGVRDCQCREGL